MPNEQEKIRITLDEIDSVVVDPPRRTPPPPPISDTATSRTWGRVDSGSSQAVGSFPGGAPNVFYKAWVYLGIAGALGAFVAWALCEPSFNDRAPAGPGNFLMFPAFVTLISVGFAVAESAVERSWNKGVSRGVLAIILGVILGFIFYLVANVIYAIGLRALYDAGVQLTSYSLLHSLVRAVAWSVFGVTGGLVYGIAGRSSKKCLYGILGGIIGAAIGGFVFDPINIAAGVAGPSRCLGVAIMGASTGIGIGLVESALKDRWLYVSSGPLSGKQFILYKPQTRIGGDQSNDIYLFKDTSIQSQHALIDLSAGRAVLTALASTFISGQPVTKRTLQNGDLVQIGRYGFRYQEKQKSS